MLGVLTSFLLLDDVDDANIHTCKNTIKIKRHLKFFINNCLINDKSTDLILIKNC